MSYIKFKDSKDIVECNVIVAGNVATLKFRENVVINTSGFKIYLDENGYYDIGGNSYEKFTTIYRNDEETLKYNGYQISNDGSVYEKNENLESIYKPELKEKEIAEKNKIEKISELNGQIITLKDRLNSTDYIFIKHYEASLAGEILEEYDFDSIHKERNLIREEINQLENKMKNFLDNVEE